MHSVRPRPQGRKGEAGLKNQKVYPAGVQSVQKGYRVFDHLTQKVSYSRNVKFDEREIGGSPVEEEKSAQRPIILNSVDEQRSDCEEKEGDTSNDTSVTEALPRRSTRERRQVDYYSYPQATSRFTVNPPPLKKQSTAQKKQNGTKL